MGPKVTARFCSEGAASLTGRAACAGSHRLLALAWLGFGWLFLGFGLIWLDLVRFRLDGLISLGFGLAWAGFRLELAWILHFRLLLLGFVIILASHRLS